MRLFLDTEFTKLEPGAKLISIALVDDNGDNIYVELTDSYKVRECSPFVKQFVLRFLRGGEYKMPTIKAAEAIGNWIEDRNEPCILACDNPTWDVPLLKRLLEDCWPRNLTLDFIFPVAIMDVVKDDIIVEYDFDIHNALDDAMVMQIATHRQGR